MWVVITRDQCNFCDSAKALLKGKGYSYTEYNVQSPSSRWLLTLIKQAGHTTVPQIFNPKGVHVGGYTELKEQILETSTKEF
jgi:glutaredoxin 3